MKLAVTLPSLKDRLLSYALDCSLSQGPGEGEVAAPWELPLVSVTCEL